MAETPLNTTAEYSAPHNAMGTSGNPELDMYKQRLARSAYDAEAWIGLVNLAKYTGDDALLHQTYTGALKQYPSSGQLLASLAELELRLGNRESAEAIFNSNLFSVPSTELWQCYLSYVLKSNVDGQGVVSQPERRATVMECYRLVLDNIGCDREAGCIWADYIGFLSSGQVNAPYEEQQKIEKLREAYQAAVAVPHHKVEEIWKGYDMFENKIDRATARQMLSRTSPSYMTARTVLRAMNKHWEAIKHNQPPHGIPAPPEWSPREIDYLDAWKQYLKWETSNPLNLSDSAALCRRVIYAYSQACIALRFYPEIWIEFAEYLSSLEQHSEALAKLRSASQVLPSSLAVQFAYAEMAEKHKQPDVSKQVYEQIVTLARSEIDSTTERSKHKLEKFDKRLELIDSKMAATESRKEMQETEVDEQAATAAAAEELAASFDSESDDIDDSDMSDDASQASTAGPSGATALFERAKRRVDARVAGTKARMERELVEKREIYTLAWIMYMRFVQRAEGIDAVRQLLRRPRADPSGYVTHHLFVAAALMEYHVAKKPGIAAKLFEFYSKMHSDQSAYIFEYLSYLINSGDDTNARALFERFQGTSTGDSGDMWSMFADFEYNYGDMSAIAKLDKRFIDKFEHESVLTRLAARYSYLDVASVAENEFGFPFRKEYRGDAPASSGHRRSTAALGDASPADIDSGSEFAGVAVASVSGRHLLKSQLLALVTPKRFVKMNTSALEEYDPIIEDFEPPEPQLHGNDAVSDSRHAASPIGVSSAMLLERGDLLSFVAASVASIDPQGFDSPALDPDALLESIMELRGLKQQQVQSNYRPLAYMPRHGSAGVPQSRPGRHGGHPHAPLGRGRGYSGPGESSYGGRRPFTAPRRSPHKNQSHRLPPYSRSPSGNSRPPRHDSYGSRRSRSRGASYDDGGY